MFAYLANVIVTLTICKGIGSLVSALDTNLTSELTGIAPDISFSSLSNYSSYSNYSTHNVLRSSPAVALSKAESETVWQSSLMCIMETGVTPGIVLQIQSNSMSNDPTTRKFLYCFFDKIKYIENGTINKTKILSLLGTKYDEKKDAVKKVIDDCDKLGGESNEDKLFKFVKCFQSNSPTNIKLTF